MAPLITLVNNLNPKVPTSIIKVRCVRLYENNPGDKNDKTLEAVFHDRMGTRIQASFPGGLCQKIVAKLREGGIFCFKNFLVRPNNLKNKTTSHQFRLTMVAKTEMFEVTDPKFQYCMFSFKNFDEIARLERNAEETFFDVIGVIVAPGRVLCQPKCRLIEIEIADENHNRIFCTIWDANVDSYLQQLVKSKGTLPIIIVQFCRPNMFIGEMRVSTHFNSSQVFINADISEVKQFRSGISGDPTFMSMVSLGEVGNMISSEFDDLQLKSLDDVLCLQSGSYWVFGRVVSVECHYGQWFYESCKICVKKLEKVAPGKYNCVHCKKTFVYAAKRYKFVLNIVDDTSNVSLLLWDREAFQLLEKTVNEVIDANEVYLTDIVPKEIEDKLLGQDFLFKLQLKDHFDFPVSYPFTVSTVCKTPEIVEKYMPEGFSAKPVSSMVKLSDLLFGDDLTEVSEKSFLTSDLSSLENVNNFEWIVEGSVKRSLDMEFDACKDDTNCEVVNRKKVHVVE